jgi:hypothetical protein
MICHSLSDPLSRRTNVNIAVVSVTGGDHFLAGINVTGDHFLAGVGDTDYERTKFEQYLRGFVETIQSDENCDNQT